MGVEEARWGWSIGMINGSCLQCSSGLCFSLGQFSGFQAECEHVIRYYYYCYYYYSGHASSAASLELGYAEKILDC